MKKIFLSGGGTLGSVMPLLALRDALKAKYDLVWIGSYTGVERRFLMGKQIKYIPIHSGKWRKYFDLRNLLTPIFVLSGFLSSLFLILFFRPSLIVVSGSFISVPLVWAGWILRIPRIVHQEDIHLGLAGVLTVPFASVVTTAFKETSKGAKWIGNPVRAEFFSVDKNKADKKWKTSDLPLVLVLGGGLGSDVINNQIKKSISGLSKVCSIVHITGPSKKTDIENKNYKQFEMLDSEFLEVVVSADLVVSRAGLSTIAELSKMGKPTIFIPLARVTQDINAKYLEKRGAAIVLDEEKIEGLEDLIIEVLKDKERQRSLAENIKKIFPQDSLKKMVEIVEGVVK